MGNLSPKNDETYYMSIHGRANPIPLGAADLSVLEVGHICSPGGIIYPKTQTTFCILNWCVDGELIFDGEGWSISAKAGEIAVIDINTVITTYAPKQGCDFYYILVDGNKANELLKTSNLWTGAFPYEDLPLNWLEMIVDGLNDPDKEAFIKATALFLYQNAGAQAQQLSPDPLVWRAKQYLHRNWQNPETNVESVLNHLNVSRSMFSPRFKNQTGRTILEFLSDLRYSNALSFLREGSLSINAIARECGFITPSHFTAWFHKKSGETPKTIQRRLYDGR